ncbi:MAG: hypothetical protein WD773_05085 [Gemmatimonadales bacterium]
MKTRIAVAVSVLAILVLTLRPAGTELAPGWSYNLTSGEAALAELIIALIPLPLQSRAY